MSQEVREARHSGNRILCGVTGCTQVLAIIVYRSDGGRSLQLAPGFSRNGDLCEMNPIERTPPEIKSARKHHGKHIEDWMGKGVAQKAEWFEQRLAELQGQENRSQSGEAKPEPIIISSDSFPWPHYEILIRCPENEHGLTKIRRHDYWK